MAVPVTPRALEFDKRKEKRSYNVVFRSKKKRTDAVGTAARFGHIVWEIDVHQVRSPVELVWN